MVLDNLAAGQSPDEILLLYPTLRREDVTAVMAFAGELARERLVTPGNHDAPYLAFQIILGDLGTSGGLLTDEHARVLREDGSVIAGLYATANTSAAVMGRSYAGAGATIGPAMTFGYVAAQHISENSKREVTA